jgi:hypothetical protein
MGLRLVAKIKENNEWAARGLWAECNRRIEIFLKYLSTETDLI